MRAIEIAVQAGRRRQSLRSGFIHYFPGFEGHADTIPIFENFCFAFALFRLKTTESVKEGKEIIEKLLSFQLEDGNFPVYLHEYPKAWDFKLGAKIGPILKQILVDFGHVLNSDYKDRLKNALNKIKNPGNLEYEKGKTYPIPYNKQLQLFLGKNELQDGGEPQPLPVEYILAENDGLHGRLLRDHIHQLYSALIYPIHTSLEVDAPYSWIEKCLYWKGKTVHSLFGLQEGETIFPLPEGVEVGRDDLFEILTYCDISSETSLTINGQRGMVFHFGDVIEIHTPFLTISLCFELVGGRGDFCGHISRANRPGQIANVGTHQYEAYDWQIGIRTLRREVTCIIKCTCGIKNKIY